MKKIINYIPDWLLMCIFIIIFLVAWPAILIGVGIKFLYSNKSSDSLKIEGAKMAIMTLVGLIVASIVILYKDQVWALLRHFPVYSSLIIVIVGITILLVFRKSLSGVNHTNKEHSPAEKMFSPEKLKSQLKESPPVLDREHAGTSLEDAIIIKGAQSTEIGLVIEEYYLNFMHPNNTFVGQSVVRENGRIYDIMEIQDGNDKLKVYFDITEFFGK
jgi:hypothetical protein